MDRDIDERTQALLGRYLLGRASPDEVRELETLRGANDSLRDAMDVVRRSAADYRRSAAGEDLPVTSADLPDYLRPEELARGLERWFWQWLVATVGSYAAVLTLLLAAAVNFAPNNDPAGIARSVFIPAGLAMVVIVVRAWFAREGLARRVASGGPSWERTVAEVRRQERWFLSPLGSSLMGIGVGLTATAFAVAVALPRPGAGYALVVATVGLALTLKIAKRRFLLRGLRGEGRTLP